MIQEATPQVTNYFESCLPAALTNTEVQSPKTTWDVQIVVGYMIGNNTPYWADDSMLGRDAFRRKYAELLADGYQESTTTTSGEVIAVVFTKPIYPTSEEWDAYYQASGQPGPRSMWGDSEPVGITMADLEATFGPIDWEATLKGDLAAKFCGSTETNE